MYVTYNFRQPNGNLQLHSRNEMLPQLTKNKSFWSTVFSDMDITKCSAKVFKLIEHHARKISQKYIIIYFIDFLIH